MREIKFRAKLDKESFPNSYNKDWVYGFVSKYNGDWCIDTYGNDGSFVSDEQFLQINGETIGQYTGLKDKNGKEIYEGDVLQYKHYYAVKRWWNSMSEIEEIEKSVQKQRDDYHLERNKITFGSGSFNLGYFIKGEDLARGYKFEKGQSYRNDFEEKYWDFEVIGNIYDNPELLEGSTCNS